MPLSRGDVRFTGPIHTAEGDLFVMAQGVDWNSSGGSSKEALHLTFYVAEDVSGLREQVDVYRRTLAISIETIVTLAGRRDVEVSWEPTADGAVYRLTWSA